MDNKISKSVSNEIQPNKQCYCQGLLTKCVKPDGFAPCMFCCKQISNDDKVIYSCLNSQCIYRQTAGQPYTLCIDCFNRMGDTDTDNKENDHKNEGFIYNKFQSSLGFVS